MSPAVERIPCKSEGRRRDAIKSLLTAPIPYLAPLMVGAAPRFFLHWLYQPIVRANPGLGAYKAPVATLMLPPLRQLADTVRAQIEVRSSSALQLHSMGRFHSRTAALSKGTSTLTKCSG
jgi:hypothetical protein